MSKTVNVGQAALAKARQRRIALDADRDARDRRLEAAVAQGLMLLQHRAEIEQRLADTNIAIGLPSPGARGGRGLAGSWPTCRNSIPPRSAGSPGSGDRVRIEVPTASRTARRTRPGDVVSHS